MNHDSLDIESLRTDYTAVLRSSILTLVKAHAVRTKKPFKEVWDGLYARLLETCQFDAEEYRVAHKLKSKLDAVAQAGYLDQLRSLAEELS